MATVRQHLQKAHEKMASHHAAMAESHKVASDFFGKLAKLHKADVDAHGVYDGLKDSHAGMADHHEAQAAFHAGAMEECSKALESDMNKIAPDRISAIHSGHRMIPRVGQRPPSEMDKVAVEFQELVGLSDLD